MSSSESEHTEDDRKHLTYDGSRIPSIVVIVWVAFFVWGLIYLVRWIPESWREWFTR